jgi:kynurenine formamidase
MPYFDLSHSLENGMPFYPGTEAPHFSEACSIKKYGFKETRLKILSHIGTHLDTPAHIFEDGKGADELPVSQFTGSAFVLDVSDAGKELDRKLLERCEAEIAQADFLLLHTAWSRYWGMPEYYENFPVLSRSACVYLSQMHLKGIGLDTISIDAADNHSLTNHKIILKEGTVIIENLKIPAEIIGKTAKFYAFPLKLRNGDGSPVRAVAFL